MSLTSTLGKSGCPRCGSCCFERMATHSYCSYCNYWPEENTAESWQIPLWVYKALKSKQSNKSNSSYCSNRI